MNNELNTQAAAGAAPAAEAAVAPPTGWREVLDRMRTENGTHAGQERPGMLIDSIEDALGELEGAAPVAAQVGQVAVPFDFHAHLARQATWSEKTFGPGPRTRGVCDHIRKELLEIEADPLDLREWIDVVILGLDGAWRCGGTPEQIIAGIVAKQTKNEGRTWPDWRTADPDKAIEHDRSAEAAQASPSGVRNQEGGSDA